MSQDITEIILNTYRKGLFPMSDGREAPDIYLVEPEKRALLPIADFHVSRRLKETLRARNYEITVDTDFSGVLSGCADFTKNRETTWINHTIESIFNKLNDKGYAHSIEYREEGKLLGGVYGLSIGGIFCAESMFSRVSGASKIALVHLAARLWKADYTLWDVQFTNPHLEQFGVYEIPQPDYLKKLSKLKSKNTDFSLSDYQLSEQELITTYLEQR